MTHSLLTLHESGQKRQISCRRGLSIHEALTANAIVPPGHCGGRGVCGACRIRFESAEIPPPTSAEWHLLSPEELSGRIRLACQVKPGQPAEISLAFSPTVPGWRELSGAELLPVTPPADRQLLPDHDHPFAMAIDFGTTRVRLTLWDRAQGKRLRALSSPSPHQRYGADILARITEAASSVYSARQMTAEAGQCIAEALTTFNNIPGFTRKKLALVLVVGNTAVLSLLTGRNSALLLDPAEWTKTIDCRPVDAQPLKELWGLDQDTTLHFIPPAGGVVGSDLKTAVHYTGITTSKDSSLLIDFGTNSELALWDGRRLWITSAAGGPAFDGAGIRSGMPAEPGAIIRIVAGANPEERHAEVLGGGPARGLCGSGLVDAVALLRKDGTLNASGRFRKELKIREICLLPEHPALSLSHSDIDAFQRAKAAIGAGTATLLKAAGLHPGALHRVFVCGAFGQYLTLCHAQATGLLPSLPEERFVICGGAALGGCEELLFSQDREDILATIQRSSQIIDLASQPEFEALYPAHLALEPHSLLQGEHHV